MYECFKNITKFIIAFYNTDTNKKNIRQMIFEFFLMSVNIGRGIPLTKKMKIVITIIS